MVHSGGAWDLKVALGHKQFMTSKSSAYAEPHEFPYYSRVTYHTQVYYNVWGNIFFGYVGKKEGFPAGLLDWCAEHCPGHGYVTAGNKIERPCRPAPWVSRSCENGIRSDRNTSIGTVLRRSRS
jgi:Bacterial toxin 44